VTPLDSSVKRVLVVDDENTIRELVADALTEAGYQVETASNGADALERLHDWLPHAIVVDLMMPRLDGMGFVQLVRLNPRLAGVPIVLVTATYAAQEVAERIGVRALLTKPFELDELVAKVGELVGTPLPLASPPPLLSQSATGCPAKAPELS
jgi:CheY-like chemotaxis protein